VSTTQDQGSRTRNLQRTLSVSLGVFFAAALVFALRVGNGQSLEPLDSKGSVNAATTSDVPLAGDPLRDAEAVRERVELTGREPGRALYVLCADDQGAPRGFAEIFVLPQEHEELLNAGEDRCALRRAGARIAWTNANGLAEFLDVAIGEHVVGVVPKLNGRHPRPASDVDYRVTIHDDEDAVAFLDLLEPAIIRGRVLAAGGATWHTKDGAARIRARSLIGNGDPWSHAETLAYLDRYELAVRPGRVRLEVESTSHVSALGRLAQPQGRTVDLAPGEVLDLDWVFGESLAWVEGRVVDQFETPWVGLELRVVAIDSVHSRAQAVELTTGYTDAQGYYRLGPIPEGPCELVYGPLDIQEAEAAGIGEAAERCPLKGTADGVVNCGERVLFRRIPTKVQARIELTNEASAMPRFVSAVIENSSGPIEHARRSHMNRVVGEDGRFDLWASAHSAGRVRIEIHGDDGVRTHVVSFDACDTAAYSEELLLNVVLAYP
jgi:hypothetical protein